MKGSTVRHLGAGVADIGIEAVGGVEAGRRRRRPTKMISMSDASCGQAWAFSGGIRRGLQGRARVGHVRSSSVGLLIARSPTQVCYNLFDSPSPGHQSSRL